MFRQSVIIHNETIFHDKFLCRYLGVLDVIAVSPTTVACLNKLINTYLNHWPLIFLPILYRMAYGIRLIFLKFFVCVRARVRALAHTNVRLEEQLDLTLYSGFVLPIMSCLLIIDFVGTRHSQ